MKKIRKPRRNHVLYPGGTWLESENYCYLNGNYGRYARALCDDGRKRVFRATMADTFFSVPARGRIGNRPVRGFLSEGDGRVLHFTETNE